MRTSESPRVGSGRFASGKRSRPTLSVLKNPLTVSCALSFSGSVLSTTVPFPAPASISADVVFACPLTLVSWSAVSGARSYQLYAEQGNLPWFGSGGLQFTGPDTQKKIRTGNHLNYMWRHATLAAAVLSRQLPHRAHRRPLVRNRRHDELRGVAATRSTPRGRLATKHSKRRLGMCREIDRPMPGGG
jgi:hypothetical protein